MIMAVVTDYPAVELICSYILPIFIGMSAIVSGVS